MKNNCFICDLDRELFDRQGKGFGFHLQWEHNTWNYLYFIVHLKKKNNSDFTGIEQYVYDKISKDDLSWFPQHKAITIEEEEEEEEEAIEDITKMVEEIKTAVLVRVIVIVGVGSFACCL